LNIELFIKGLIVGIAIAAPVGPIGLLCIQRALTGGWISGLASGLGAALADTFYGASPPWASAWCRISFSPTAAPSA
jgi:threonine/homoserine/homoserine lactone efflux protein